MSVLETYLFFVVLWIALRDLGMCSTAEPHPKPRNKLSMTLDIKLLKALETHGTEVDMVKYM